MDRILTVTGLAKLSVAPDTIVLWMNTQYKNEDYDEAMRLSAEGTETLRAALEVAGFDGAELKTADFNINPEYEGRQDTMTGAYSRRFIGYCACHRMKIAFPAENALLGKALAAVMSSGAAPEFGINYTVKDTESVKNELIKKAVADSRKKAEILAEAAGVRLGPIASINYSWSSLELVSNRMSMDAVPLMAAKTAAPAMNIEPEDIDVSDTVTVIWSIG